MRHVSFLKLVFDAREEIGGSQTRQFKLHRQATILNYIVKRGSFQRPPPEKSEQRGKCQRQQSGISSAQTRMCHSMARSSRCESARSLRLYLPDSHRTQISRNTCHSPSIFPLICVQEPQRSQSTVCRARRNREQGQVCGPRSGEPGIYAALFERGLVQHRKPSEAGPATPHLHSPDTRAV